jgi:signal peptidase I
VLVVIAFALAVVLKTFLIQAFYIPSASMEPTLEVGDRVLVEKITYHLRPPHRGDVIVFTRPAGKATTTDLPWYDDVRDFLRELVGLPVPGNEDIIKRVVAVGGDSIRYQGQPRRLMVNGHSVPQGYILHGVDRHSPKLTDSDCKRLHMRSGPQGCVVPGGDLFVLGDNRGNSEDSRFIGPVDQDSVVGRAFVVLWPPGDLRGL